MASYHPKYRDQRAAIDWARLILRRKKKHVVLDTETTGLGATDEIIQLAVVDLDRNVLFYENLRPTKRKRISKDAIALHGLTMETLAGCRTFFELAIPLRRAIGCKTIITYNAAFDMRLYGQSYQLAGGFIPRGTWECAMLEYARFVGEWNDYHGGYKWHKLPSAEHSALADCLATVELIYSMARSVKLKHWYEFWVSR